MKTVIIGLSGKMGVGKSTAIEILNELVQGTSTVIQQVKFAQPLYDIQEYVYSRIKSVHVRPPSFVKDRTLLQWLGTDWGRGTISDSIWVDLWSSKVSDIEIACRAMSTAETLVIVSDDVRFDNEAATVRALNGHIVQITSNKSGDRISLINTSHSSERGIDPSYVDHVVTNDSTIESYKDSLRLLFEKIGVIETAGSDTRQPKP